MPQCPFNAYANVESIKQVRCKLILGLDKIAHD